MKKLKIGIASYPEMKARTLAFARGERHRERGEPRIWFRSVESFAKVLSERNRALLTLIAEQEPESLAELAALSGRAKSNLSRTLRTLENYKLVSLQKGPKGRVVPRVAYSDIVLDISLGIGPRSR